MTRSRTAVAVLLTLGILLLALPSRSRAQPDDEEKKARDAVARDVLRMMSALDGPNVQATAQEIGTKHELEFLHGAFNQRRRGGLGVGCGVAPLDVRDGIEITIIDLARPNRPVPASLLGRNRNELISVARTSEAIAWMTYAYTPKKKMPGKDPADWIKSNDEVIQASRQLAEAAKGGDAGTIKAAAARLNNACIDCHNIWRD
jgi:hypothetical protein